MSDFDNTGKASAWRPKKQGAPISIKCFAHRDLRKGEEFEVALWDNESDNPKAPFKTGKVQDKWKPPQDNMHRGAQPGQTESTPDFNDDIPF
jgi:hypothetical protein